MQLRTRDNRMNLVEWEISVVACPWPRELDVLSVACSHLPQEAATKMAIFHRLYANKVICVP